MGQEESLSYIILSIMNIGNSDKKLEKIAGEIVFLSILMITDGATILFKDKSKAPKNQRHIF